jgi:hypothetical protein
VKKRAAIPPPMQWLFFVILLVPCCCAAGSVELRVNNCLSDLTLLNCRDILGTWITKPKNVIPSMTRGTWSLYTPSLTSPSQGNCTFQYTNTHGNWTAFFDWEWAPLSSQSWGAGTNDEVDDERTDINHCQDVECFYDGKLCFWLYYGNGFMDCNYKVNDNILLRNLLV